MKKLLLSTLLLLTQLPLWGQTEKGRWTAGVSIGSFTYQSSETGHNFSGSLSPSVGTFVARNLLVGLGIPLSVSSAKTTNSQDNISIHSTSLGLSPFVRYYMGASALKPYIGAAVGYSYSTFNYETSLGLTTNKGNNLQLTPSVGLAYFINRSISVNAQLGYNWERFKSTTTDTYPSARSSDNPATISKNASLSLGFNIFFGQ